MAQKRVSEGFSVVKNVFKSAKNKVIKPKEKFTSE
jgi:hypothetical protein